MVCASRAWQAAVTPNRRFPGWQHFVRIGDIARAVMLLPGIKRELDVCFQDIVAADGQSGGHFFMASDLISDPEFFHLAVKGAAAHPQSFGSAALVPIAGLKRIQQHFLFILHQSAIDRSGQMGI